MRIAIAGAHATGKSTLAVELARSLPGYRMVEEAYYQIEAEGHPFADSLSLEEIEVQLERSLRCVHEERGNVIFDRSPADYVAYMLAHRQSGHAVTAEWLPLVCDAVATLDLIVYVPVERPDRIAVQHEELQLRRKVDALLRDAFIDDEWALGADVVVATGTLEERVAQVMTRLTNNLRSPRP